MTKGLRISFFLWAGVSATAYILLAYVVPREHALQTLGLYLLVGFLSLWAITKQHLSVTTGIAAGIIFRVIFLFALPSLSDDYLRALWDGELVSKGISPYAYLPSDVPDSIRPQLGSEADALFAFKNYYSVYPPLSQVLFALSRWLSPESIQGSVIVLRLMVLLMEIGTLFIIMSLIRRWHAGPRFVLLYALNPLVIIELTGNLHMEAAMIFFIVLSIWLLDQRKLMSAAVSFGLAISAKLIPVLLIVFLFKRIGWRRTLAFGTMASVVFIAGFVPFGLQHVDHVTESLRLYYNNFEFNASLFAVAKNVGGYDSAVQLGPFFAALSVAALVIVSIADRTKDLKSVFTAFLIFIALYHMLATTVNPWYLAPLVLFSVFSPYRFGLLWTLLIPMSYGAFSNVSYQQETFWLVVQYVPVYVLLAFELTRRTRTINWLHQRYALWRAGVKIKRINSLTTGNDPVLDIGTGRGGVAHLLKQRGVQVVAIDIKDNSALNGIRPLLFDGHKMPFADGSFRTAMLLTVLHHTPRPDDLLREAVRVSGSQIIVMEDVYRTKLQLKLTHWMDSLVNWEFATHPHTNKTELEWEELFASLGLRVVTKRVHRPLLVFRQVTYGLRK